LVESVKQCLLDTDMDHDLRLGPWVCQHTWVTEHHVRM